MIWLLTISLDTVRVVGVRLTGRRGIGNDRDPRQIGKRSLIGAGSGLCLGQFPGHFPCSERFQQGRKAGANVLAKSALEHSFPAPLLPACHSPWYYSRPCTSVAGVEYSLNYSCPGLALMYPAYLSLLMVALVSGCRIGELLRLTAGDLVAIDLVCVRGSKGSRDGLLCLPDLSHQLGMAESLTPSLRLFPWPYRTIYRAWQHAGVGFPGRPGGNNFVTHAPRKLLANSVAAVHGLAAAGDVLRHKSPHSITYYVNERRDEHGKAIGWCPRSGERKD